MEVDMATAIPCCEMKQESIRARRRGAAILIRELRIVAAAAAALAACILQGTATASAADQITGMSDPPTYSGAAAGYYDYVPPQLLDQYLYDPISSGGGSWGYNQSLRDYW
jgi:hypothetical protein